MKGRWLWIVIGANLLVLVALAFVYPHLMVSPGRARVGHAALTTDCFACHAPLRGAIADRCIACHALPDIGLRTTKGVPIKADRQSSNPLKMSFHQELTEPELHGLPQRPCGPKLTQRSRKPFSHALLRVATRDRCDICHAAPTNDIHRNLTIGCEQCHKSDAWKPARFDHAALSTAELARCETCHKAPTDTLHRQIKGNCAHCHTPQGMEAGHVRSRPAVFARR